MTTYDDNQTDQTEQPNAVTAMLTTVQAAHYLGLAVSTLNKWRCHGGGPKFLKLGRAVRYRQSDLEMFVAERVLGSTNEVCGRTGL